MDSHNTLSRRTLSIIVSFLFLIGASLFAAVRGNSEQDVEEQVTELQKLFSTGTAERQIHRLVDGTEIHLNAQSALHIVITNRLRSANLSRGEVYFKVASDPSRPFVIDTGLTSIKVLGTSFNVDVRENKVAIMVDEGHVRVGSDWIQDLFAGQQVEITHDGMGRVTAHQMDSRIDWRSGWTEVTNASLSDVIDRLQRYSDSPIQIEPSVKQNIRLSGRYDLQKPEQTLLLIAAQNKLRVSFQRNKYIIGRKSF